MVLAALLAAFLVPAPFLALAASGTEGASFLDIPLGGRPAAMGSAYSSLSVDAYAPSWNPGGLGFLKASELSLTHLSYVDSMGYEFLSFVHPFPRGGAFGLSAHYFRPGKVSGADAMGNPTGDFTGYFAAYSAAYGIAVHPALSIGVTGRWIQGRIDEFSSSAFSADAGALLRLNRRLSLAAVGSNIGSQVKFISAGDPQPMQYRAGVSYLAIDPLTLAFEAGGTRSGTAFARAGLEWRPVGALSLRGGYKTDALRRSSGLNGLTMGLGLQWRGYGFDYAWVPLGDLGYTQYFSLTLKFSRS